MDFTSFKYGMPYVHVPSRRLERKEDEEMIENLTKISGRCADVTVESTSYGFKIRQKGSWIALSSAMFDELVSVVDDLETGDSDDSGKLGELYTSPAVTPAKYAAGAHG